MFSLFGSKCCVFKPLSDTPETSFECYRGVLRLHSMHCLHVFAEHLPHSCKDHRQAEIRVATEHVAGLPVA